MSLKSISLLWVEKNNLCPQGWSHFYWGLVNIQVIWLFIRFEKFPIRIKALGLGIKYWHTVSCGNSPNELLFKTFIHESINFEKSA